MFDPPYGICVWPLNSAARGGLERITNGLNAGISGDLLAQDIRQALHHLGALTGSITTEDLLEQIFSKFCIGK